jgi:uncharacterized protein YcbK (DUF882 family)
MAHLRRLKIAVLILPLALSACAGSDFVNFFKPAKITWNDTSWCTPLQLKSAITKVAKNFGPVRVHSTHRWPLENKRKGGKPKSYHLTCRAVDFSVQGGSPNEIKNYLKSMWEVGGYSYYPRGNFFHIDTGPRRTW